MSTARSVTTEIGGVLFVEDTFTPTGGQTLFVVSQNILSGGRVDFYVNGWAATEGSDFSRGPGANEITWSDALFTLDGADCVMIKFRPDS